MTQPTSDALFAAGHEENFPVASWLMPAAVRPSVIEFYRVARLGDDLADEGDAPPIERLAALDALAAGLQGIASTASAHAAAGQRFYQHCLATDLDPGHALALLTAFRHDSDFRPFADWNAVGVYCTHSANPVGRFVLSCFFQSLSEDLEQASDDVCTGLQLVNFAQDIGQDLQGGRPTLPRPVWAAGWS